jgi:PleD family two-component response regulator
VARVAALLPDLLFGSKLTATLERAGHDVTACAREEEVWAEAADADVLVVDLTSDEVDGLTLVDSMRAGGELRGTRTLGFYSHVDAATRARAAEVGFDLVVPRSRIAREAEALVGGLVEAG